MVTPDAPSANRWPSIEPVSNLRSGHWNNNATAGFAVGRLLSQNLVSEVPREQHRVLRLIFDESLGRIDRQVAHGEAFALFGDAAIDDILEILLTDAAIAGQGYAFSCRAVRCNA